MTGRVGAEDMGRSQKRDCREHDRDTLALLSCQRLDDVASGLGGQVEEDVFVNLEFVREKWEPTFQKGERKQRNLEPAWFGVNLTVPKPKVGSHRNLSSVMVGLGPTIHAARSAPGFVDSRLKA